MKNRFYKQKYLCKCGKIAEHRVWSNGLHNAIHKCNCGKDLTIKNIHNEEKPLATAIRTPTKNR